MYYPDRMYLNSKADISASWMLAALALVTFWVVDALGEGPPPAAVHETAEARAAPDCTRQHHIPAPRDRDWDRACAAGRGHSGPAMEQ